MVFFGVCFFFLEWLMAALGKTGGLMASPAILIKCSTANKTS